MNQQGSTIAAVVGVGVVVIGLSWFLLSFGEPSRKAHRPAEVEMTTAREFGRIADQLEKLTDRIGTLGQVGPAYQATTAPAPTAPFELPAGQIPVRRIDQPLPAHDPLSPVWNEAVAVNVPLEPQRTTAPVLDTPVLSQMRVRALTDGLSIAWHLSWAASDPSYYVDADRFTDAAALQFPLVANAPYTMGDRDMPVQIIQWNALWQRDVDEHFQEVLDLYPDYWSDLYWFADTTGPARAPDDFTRPEALDYFIPFRAGNPLADMFRERPVQEMISEGFGTITPQARCDSDGRGVWRDGQWHVVITRPLQTTDPQDHQFKPGERNVVAFAVWDGATGNVGGRKHHSQWIVYEVQP